MADFTEEELAGLSEEEKEGLLETDDTEAGTAGDVGGTEKPGEGAEGVVDAEKAAADAKEVDDKGVKIEEDTTKDEDKGKDGVQVEDEEEVIDVPAPVKAVPLVDQEEAKTRIAEITEEVKAVHEKIGDLRKQYDEGAIDVDEFDSLKEAVYAEEKVLEKEQTTLEVTMNVSEGMQQRDVQTQWVGAQENYTKQIHPEIDADPRIRSLFVAEVNTILGSEAGKALGNYDILKKAYKEMSYLIPKLDAGETPEAQKIRLVAEAKKIAATRARGKAPLTLKDVGAAEENLSSAGKFAYLDKLDGAALEEAMGKMSEADMAAYAKEK